MGFGGGAVDDAHGIGEVFGVLLLGGVVALNARPSDEDGALAWFVALDFALFRGVVFVFGAQLGGDLFVSRTSFCRGGCGAHGKRSLSRRARQPMPASGKGFIRV